VTLERAMPALGIGDDVEVATADERVRIRYSHQTLADVCEATRVDLAPWHVQGGCPACSFVALVVARAHEAPVRIRECRAITQGRVELVVEVFASSPA